MTWALLVPFNVAGGQVDYGFMNVFSGTSPTSTNRPWIEANFRDVSPGTVLLTVSNLTLSGSENVNGLYFNVNPMLNADSLVFTWVGGNGGFLKPSIGLGMNQFKAGSGGQFDVRFAFESGGSSATRFTANEYMTYQITGGPNLTASDFAYLSQSVGGSGLFYAAAHVQRIGATSVSGWSAVTEITPVPEPQPAALFCFAVTVWFAVRVMSRIRGEVSRDGLALARSGRAELRAPTVVTYS